MFKYVKAYSPLASRSTSSEMYIICKGYFKVSLVIDNIYLLFIEKMNNKGYGVAYY